MEYSFRTVYHRYCKKNQLHAGSIKKLDTCINACPDNCVVTHHTQTRQKHWYFSVNVQYRLFLILYKINNSLTNGNLKRAILGNINSTSAITHKTERTQCINTANKTQKHKKDIKNTMTTMWLLYCICSSTTKLHILWVLWFSKWQCY